MPDLFGDFNLFDETHLFSSHHLSGSVATASRDFISSHSHHLSFWISRHNQQRSRISGSNLPNRASQSLLTLVIFLPSCIGPPPHASRDLNLFASLRRADKTRNIYHRNPLSSASASAKEKKKNIHRHSLAPKQQR